MDSKKCQPIINGYTCDISINQLNQFKRQNNLNFKKSNQGRRTVVELFDNKGKTVATATKYKGNSNNNIQFVVVKKNNTRLKF